MNTAISIGTTRSTTWPPAPCRASRRLGARRVAHDHQQFPGRSGLSVVVRFDTYLRYKFQNAAALVALIGLQAG